MLVLLPPSESKVRGGDPERPLDLGALSRPVLTPARRTALARLRELSTDLSAAAAALGLGTRNREEAALNREVRSGPTMPALDRFDGVLYDALGACTLDPDERAWIDGNVAIASALFGLLAPDDPIPAYRLSAGTRIPATTLGAIWRKPVAAALAAERGPVLDLRSEAYAALGPAPAGAAYIRVVTGSGSRRRALSHANKAAKGAFVRALAAGRPQARDLEEVISWARASGIRLERDAPGELALVVDDSAVDVRIPDAG